ncbi:MAG: hypothetical protein ACREOC_12585 [Gemmatimonadales bacterium]
MTDRAVGLYRNADVQRSGQVEGERAGSCAGRKLDREGGGAIGSLNIELLRESELRAGTHPITLRHCAVIQSQHDRLADEAILEVDVQDGHRKLRAQPPERSKRQP